MRFADIDRDGKLEIVATEMSYGYVMVGRPSDPQAKLLDIVADIPHPSHSAMFDLDKDGRDDLLVANLGSFLPGDHQHGGVAWLRRMEDGRYGVFEFTGFPRVADVEAGDFNGDGKPDLLVGAFGGAAPGSSACCQSHLDYSQPSFETTRLDERTGTINVIPTDLNKDGGSTSSR